MAFNLTWSLAGLGMVLLGLAVWQREKFMALFNFNKDKKYHQIIEALLNSFGKILIMKK
ncbi:hypothetical protein [Lactococcus garvieae]